VLKIVQITVLFFVFYLSTSKLNLRIIPKLSKNNLMSKIGAKASI
jgi:hypothetical protein